MKRKEQAPAGPSCTSADEGGAPRPPNAHASHCTHPLRGLRRSGATGPSPPLHLQCEPAAVPRGKAQALHRGHEGLAHDHRQQKPDGRVREPLVHGGARAEARVGERHYGGAEGEHGPERQGPRDGAVRDAPVEGLPAAADRVAAVPQRLGGERRVVDEDGAVLEDVVAEPPAAEAVACGVWGGGGRGGRRHRAEGAQGTAQRRRVT